MSFSITFEKASNTLRYKYNTMAMTRSEHKDIFYQLRSQYEFFEFESFHIELTSTYLQCTYNFNLSGKIYFYPVIKVPFKPIYRIWKSGNLNEEFLRNIFFHIGMVELISYWKAACPPKVIISPYSLDNFQVSWWKNLYYQGLGEFFYLNSLETNMEDFMAIKSEGKQLNADLLSFADGYIVPVGGGKDSAVSLELLKSLGNVTPFLLNPRKSMSDTLMAAEIPVEEAIEIYRTIDPELLRINDLGFLNGHTPFSALLAFQTLLGAYLSGKKNIALSNEGSANEATIPGTMINHQYSKSFAFEKDFREYVSKYISSSFNYFSFLRPLAELQIGQLFSRFPQHFQTFRSCNVGSKTDSWCGKCPKCLFAWVILSPFLGEPRLNDIFGSKLLDDPEMMFFLKQLMGETPEKPFECIGTTDEVKLALFLIMKMTMPEPPLLVSQLMRDGLIPVYTEAEVKMFFQRIEDPHFLSQGELTLIQQNIACPKY